MTSGAPKVLDLFSLRGRTALVTGACGQLGRQHVDALAEAGARVILADIEEKRVLALAQDASKRHGVPMLGLALDVTKQAHVEDALRQAMEWSPTLDVLVNNAGIGLFTSWETRTEEEAASIIDINLKGVLWCTQVFSRPMRAQKRGSIVNLGSIYGLVSADPRVYGASGRNSAELYAATKGGVVQMTRYMSVHLAPDGVRVNSISPGGVFNHQDAGFVKEYEQRTPMGRMAREDELKGALVYLASDASSYLTGQNLVVDGGWTAW